jgi:hypothetical protein
MQRDVIVVEEFYADPDAIVRYARGLDYVHPYQQPGTEKEGNRITWRASRYRPSKDCPFKSSSALIERLERLTGESIDREAWDLEFPVDANGYPAPGYARVTPKSAWWNCCFHVKHSTGQKLGDGVHSHTDRDTWNPVGTDGWAGLVYLNRDPPNPQGGLRTWDNKDPAHRFDWMTPAPNWILHRGNIPHSGTNGWGDSLENGRLYQTFFFRTRRRVEVAGLSPAELGLR